MIMIWFFLVLTGYWPSQVVRYEEIEWRKKATQQQVKPRLGRIDRPKFDTFFKKRQCHHDGGTAIELVREHDLDSITDT